VHYTYDFIFVATFSLLFEQNKKRYNQEVIIKVTLVLRNVTVTADMFAAPQVKVKSSLCLTKHHAVERYLLIN
jgi:hypothetical protein